jgi:hypothetical protein
MKTVTKEIFFWFGSPLQIIVMKKNHHGSKRIMMNKKMMVS